MFKNKIINDPILGFLTISDELVLKIINHPYFQRLRLITQMGLSSYVYPGALHTRFSHTLGCLFLMQEALDTLRSKGIEITNEEYTAACLAILLHDLGHGPFSHVLENTLLPAISHEKISLQFMDRLNKEFDGELSMAISIFKGEYEKKFLHQLVSGQLDVDRLDYLNRDSFYSGVQEGMVGAERIIKMINVRDGELVVEEKGIYTIEKFILSRRLMFWQVYLHKTSVCAELMLINVLKRASELIKNGKNVFTTPSLKYFLSKSYTFEEFSQDKELLNIFASLDDSDIWVCLKEWSKADDFVLNQISTRLLSRKLFKSELRNTVFEREYVRGIEKKIDIKEEFLPYFLYEKVLSPKTYNPKGDAINILKKDGTVVDITIVSELLDNHFVTKLDEKHLLCYCEF